MLAALASVAAAPLTPARAPCGVLVTSLVPLGLEQGAVVAALAVAAGDAAAGEPEAVAVELLGPGQDRPAIEMRFAFGAASAPGHRWAWLPGASAALGPGSGPAIARLPGQDPAWLVLYSRSETGGARPVAVLVRPDEEQRRLDLEPLVLERVLHVFGPLIVPGQDGALLLWGESSGSSDAIRMLPFPCGPDQAPVTIAEGLLAPRFDASAVQGGLAAAWLEENASSPEGWILRTGIFDAQGKPVKGPVEAAAFETPARLLGLAARDDGIDVHLLVGRPLLLSPVTISMGPGLSDPKTLAAGAPAFSPSTTVSAAVVPAGLVLAWRSHLGPGSVLWAWSGHSRWPLASADGDTVAALAPAAAGAAAAWTARGRIDVLDISLADADGDHVPDMVDQCPGLAETHDGTLDHDGCPDPPGTTGSPLEAGRVWFADTADMCTRMGRAGQVLALAGGARAWIGPDGLEARDAGGSMHAIDLSGPAAGDPAAEPHGLFALPGGRIAILTQRGVAVVDPGAWTVVRWLLDGRDLWAGSWDDDRGMLVAGSGGTLFRLADLDAPAKAVTLPPGVAKDLPVSVILDEKNIIVAWRASGVFTRKGWTSGWTPLDKRPEDPASAGSRRLVRSATGEIFLVTGSGALLALEAGTWRREEAGLEGVWVRDAFVDPDTGLARVIAVGGRPLVLDPHAVDRRIVIAAKHFTASGSSVKKSIKAALGPALALVTSAKRLVRIEGYTDSSGGTKLNLALSLKRAQALASWLADQGADPGALSVIGFGEAHPLAKPSSTQNRRVEVVLLLP